MADAVIKTNHRSEQNSSHFYTHTFKMWPTKGFNLLLTGNMYRLHGAFWVTIVPPHFSFSLLHFPVKASAALRHKQRCRLQIQLSQQWKQQSSSLTAETHLTITQSSYVTLSQSKHTHTQGGNLSDPLSYQGCVTRNAATEKCGEIEMMDETTVRKASGKGNQVKPLSKQD